MVYTFGARRLHRGVTGLCTRGPWAPPSHGPQSSYGKPTTFNT
jgi:hypothetical protein